MALHRDEPLEETTNTALNDTLSRTVLTSGTTLLVVASVYILGSGAIKDFAFALIIGMVVGTYSSLFIAAPIFLWVNKRFYAGKGHLQWLEDKEREGTGALLGVGTDEDPGEVGGPSGGAVDLSRESTPEGEEGEGPDDGQRKVTRRRRRRRPD